MRLCVYALLQSGQAIPDERLNGRAKGMKAMLDHLRASTMQGYETYGRAIRASALAVYNRAEDRDCLKADVTWLINASRNGAHTYINYGYGGYRRRMLAGRGQFQFCSMVCWVCGRARKWGLRYRDRTGRRCRITGMRRSWSMASGIMMVRGEGTLSMSVAGIASLFVTHDYLDARSLIIGGARAVYAPPCAGWRGWRRKTIA
jgi:hypothetical protein